jgi:hypothetical protein
MALLAIYEIYRQYSFTIGGYHFGFVDAQHNGTDVTLLQLGPLGQFHHVPVSAFQGCVISALLLATLLVAFIWMLSRRLRAA